MPEPSKLFQSLKFRFASESEIAERKRLTLALLGEVQVPTSLSGLEQAAGSELPADLLSYLRLVAETPDLASTERDRQAHISPKRGIVLRAGLLRRGLVFVTSARKGPGRPEKNFYLTVRGKELLGL